MRSNPQQCQPGLAPLFGVSFNRGTTHFGCKIERQRGGHVGFERNRRRLASAYIYMQVRERVEEDVIVTRWCRGGATQQLAQITGSPADSFTKCITRG